MFPIHETHFDSKIKDSVETICNPSDNESTFLSTDSRTTQRKKRETKNSYRKNVHRYTSKRFANDEEQDPEIEKIR
jgi:hypothetical protein